MKTDSQLTECYDKISWHITGCFPIKELPIAERDYKIIHLCYFQMGFEPLIIAVYSDHGCDESDACQSAEEFLAKRRSDSFGESIECDRVKTIKLS